MKNVKTFEGWKNDRAEMEMRKSGDEIMRKAAEEKAAEAGNKDVIVKIAIVRTVTKRTVTVDVVVQMKNK